MLLKSYRKDIFRPKCNPSFQSVHCVAHLEEDVAEVLPYLNSRLGGFQYTQSPPSVTFRVQGRLITVHAREIAINALKDEEEADRILEWLRREINETWDQRAEIEPSTTAAGRPKVLDILKLLPGTNCGECGQPTCMVFAVRAAEGVKGAQDCPPMDGDRRNRLEAYLAKFQFDD